MTFLWNWSISAGVPWDIAEVQGEKRKHKNIERDQLGPARGCAEAWFNSDYKLYSSISWHQRGGVWGRWHKLSGKGWWYMVWEERQYEPHWGAHAETSWTNSRWNVFALVTHMFPATFSQSRKKDVVAFPHKRCSEAVVGTKSGNSSGLSLCCNHEGLKKEKRDRDHIHL